MKSYLTALGGEDNEDVRMALSLLKEDGVDLFPSSAKRPRSHKAPPPPPPPRRPHRHHHRYDDFDDDDDDDDVSDYRDGESTPPQSAARSIPVVAPNPRGVRSQSGVAPRPIPDTTPHLTLAPPHPTGLTHAREPGLSRETTHARELELNHAAGAEAAEAAAAESFAVDESGSLQHVRWVTDSVDPIYGDVEVVGCFTVGGMATECTITKFVPQIRDRSVGLVALSADAKQLSAWMDPVDLGDDNIWKMEVHVSGPPGPCALDPAPSTWNIPASRDAWRPGRTALLRQIRGPMAGSIHVAVAFKGSKGGDCDVELWSGCIAVVAFRDCLLSNFCNGIPNAPPPVLSPSDDDHVASDVSALCPYMRLRMTKPCRGLRCEHAQCFELLPFVTMCVQRHLWVCPICLTPLPPHCVVADAGQQAAFNAARDQTNFIVDTSTGQCRPRPSRTNSAASASLGARSSTLAIELD